MGFGTLFIGYFLLLNITMPGISDIIAALVMLLGLYRLKGLNGKFKAGFYVVCAFTAYALFELVIWGLDIMKLIDVTELLPYTGMLRSLFVAALSIAILSGIHDVAKEVELERLPRRATAMIYLSAIVFGVAILMEAPVFTAWSPMFYSVMALIAILGSFVVIIINLTIIYTAYARICMPGEEKRKSGGSGKGGGFFESFRRRRAEKEAEDAEYLAEEARKRSERRSGKK